MSLVKTPRPVPISAKAPRGVAVALGRDGDELGLAEAVGHDPGLRRRQPAAARPEPDHSTAASPKSSVTASAYGAEPSSAASCFRRTVGPVKELVHDPAGQGVEALALGVGEVAEARPLELGDPDALGVGAQAT